MIRSLLFITCISLLFFSCKKENDFTPFVRKTIQIDWMSGLIENYPEKDILFSEICLPGSHDAGMYILRKCSFGANPCNTQTQHLDMYDQLSAGYRIFDLRPALVGGEIYAQHATECGGLGCQGDFMENIFEMTNEFLENYNEVVIFQLGHFCGISGNDTIFLKMLEETLGDKIYRETEYLENMYDWSLQKVLGEKPQSGKVILIFENGMSNTVTNRSNGYFSSSIKNFVGGWSNKNIYSELKEDQLRRYTNYQPISPMLFQFSYQMTQDEKMAIACALGDQSGSIKSFSVQTNSDFPLVIDSLIQSGEINSNKLPNVFWTDYGEEWMIDIAQKISILGIEK